MNFRARRPQSPTVDLTPLIDVVFLLLIFFMVSTTFTSRKGLELQLPQAETQTEEAATDSIRIAVDAQGDFAVNGEPVAKARLQEVLAAHAPQAGQTPRVVVAADRKARHGWVTRAMDAASQAGLSRFTIQAQPAATESETP